MKKLLILLFIVTPLISYSQFNFPGDANFKFYHLETLKNFDIKPDIEKSTNFELRLWISTFTEQPVLLRLTYNNNFIWKAEKYLLNDNRVIKSELLLPDKWDDIWDSLVVNKILTLPDNPPIIHHKVAEEGEIPYVEVAITDGTSYTVELLSNEHKRHYSIDNPIGYFRYYKNSQPLKDFNRILEILSEVFQYKFK